MYDNQLTLIFGERALAEVQDRQTISTEIDKLTKQNEVLLQQAQNAFNANLSSQDIIVAAATGVLCGAVSGCFKSFVPQHGKLKHKHGTQRRNHAAKRHFARFLHALALPAVRQRSYASSYMRISTGPSIPLGIESFCNCISTR